MLKKILNIFLLALSISVITLIANNKYDYIKVNKDINQVVIEEVDNNIDNLVSNYIKIEDLNNLRYIRENEQQTVNLTNKTNETEFEVIRNVIHDVKQSVPNEFDKLTKTTSELEELVKCLDSNFTETLFRTNQIIQYSIGASLANLLIRSGLSKFVVNVIVGAIKAAIAVAKQWWMFPPVRAIIIGGLLTAITISIVANWHKIEPIFHNIMDVLRAGLRNFVHKVTNFFNSILGLVVEVTKKVTIAIEKVKQMSIQLITDLNRRVFNLAYLKDGLKINRKYDLNYIEAFAYLRIKLKLSKWSIIDKIKEEIEKFKAMFNVEKAIPIKPIIKRKKKNKVTGKMEEEEISLVGVYTPSVIDAGSLAKFTGCTKLDKAETHGSRAKGYYPHYHDPERRIHIWFEG